MVGDRNEAVMGIEVGCIRVNGVHDDETGVRCFPSNESLAHLADSSPTQFGRAFRESTGLSPQRWQMDARVRFAQRLMVDNPALSLSLIASQSGFADQSHFSRAFLDILGTTPTAWLHQRR